MVNKVETYCVRCGAYKTIYVDNAVDGSYFKFKCEYCGYEHIYLISSCYPWDMEKLRKSVERSYFDRIFKANVYKDSNGQTRTLTKKRH